MKPTVGLTKIFLGGKEEEGRGDLINVYGRRVVFEKYEDFEGMLNLFSLQGKAAVFLQWAGREFEGIETRITPTNTNWGKGEKNPKTSNSQH